MQAIAVRNLVKTFDRRHRALDGVELGVGRGEMVALIGASGSGKSTLIRHIAGLTVGDGGEVRALGEVVQTAGRHRAGAREVRGRIGVIFQQFNLVGRLSLLTNVLIGLLGQIPPWRGYCGRFTRAEQRHAMACLHRVGLHRFAAQRCPFEVMRMRCSTPAHSLLRKVAPACPSSRTVGLVTLCETIGWYLPSGCWYQQWYEREARLLA